MKNKVVIFLLVFALVLLLVCGGAMGYVWYRDNHVFVGDDVYPIDSQHLDLRERTISESYYLELQGKLPDCRILWNVPFQGNRLSNDTPRITITELNETDIAVLKAYFPELQTVDASACEDYAILESLKAQLSQVTVDYQVSVGAVRFAPDTTELTLEEGSYDLAVLTQNLKHLPQVTAIALPKTTLSLEQIGALKEAFPQIEVGYTIELLGQEYGPDTTHLDLSSMTAEELPGVMEKFPMLPELASIELCDAEGNAQLSMEDAGTLIKALPEAQIHYSFTLLDQTVSTDTEELHFKNQKIDEAQLRLALDLLTGCKRIVLENSGLSNETLAKIRDDYRDRTKVVWRVYFGGGSTLTDVDVIRCTYDLFNDNCHNLYYCEDARYMDIGHNEELSTVEFVAGMKSLEVVIVSGAPIRDLSPFASCKNLRILEIAFCGYVEDISPLAACEKLEMLNIGFTKVTDLSALDDKNMTRLCAMRPTAMVPYEEQVRFQELHPDCYVTFVGRQPYGTAWRYDSKNDPLPWYQDIKVAFKYPHSPNNAGWYLS